LSDAAFEGEWRLSEYEQRQLQAVRAWRAQPPSIANRALVKLLSPAVYLVDQVVPVEAIEAVIESTRKAGLKLADADAACRAAGVAQLSELQGLPLARCDELALSVQRWAVGMAAGEGAATGAAGLVGLVLDIPAALLLSFRTIYKIGLCYGYVPNPRDVDFVHGVMAAAGANTMQEKLAALACLQAIRGVLHQQSWRMMASRAAEHAFSREGAILAVRALARQLGVNLTKRKALQAIPVLGALVGASVNAWYIRDVASSARRAYQERWLAQHRAVRDAAHAGKV
jgi:hypothetical protein